MTDGPQQRGESPESHEEFGPQPGQPTLPFRAVPPDAGQQPPAGGPPPEPGYGYPPQQPGYGYPQGRSPAPPTGYGYPQPGPGDPRAQPPAGYGYPQEQPPPAPQSGYGYPPGQAPAAPQSGYGYPQQAGPAPGPAWTPPATPLGGRGAEPDWSALAARNEEGHKRRRLLMAGGAVAAALVVAGIVVTAISLSGGHRPSPAPTSSAGATDTASEPTPSFTGSAPPPGPSATRILASDKLDTAPLSASGLFPGKRLNWHGDVFRKEAVAQTASCSAVTSHDLAADLDRNGCLEVMRATYQGRGTTVTVGVAVFRDQAAAGRAKAGARPYVLPLYGGTATGFCHLTHCQSAFNAFGRYAYFTIAGRTDDVGVTADDPATKRADGDIQDYAFQAIYGRGRQEAATAAP